jgi:hypothetical protein
MTLHTRGPAPADTLVEQARAQIAALDADLPILLANPSSKQITGSLILFNVTASMLFVFGIAGMALAALGTYGPVSYTVKRSTHEIGDPHRARRTTPRGCARISDKGRAVGGDRRRHRGDRAHAHQFPPKRAVRPYPLLCLPVLDWRLPQRRS